MKYLWVLLIALPFLGKSQTINVTRPVAALNSTANGASYDVAAFTPTAGTLLVLFVYANESVTASPAVTSTGLVLTWTLQAAQTVGVNRYYIYWARVGGTTASMTINFNCTGDNATGVFISVHQFQGYDKNRANPIRQTFISAATTTSATPNITFTNALQTNNGYVIGWAAGVNTATSTQPAGWTESDDVNHNNPNSKLSTARRNGGLTSAGPFTFTNGGTSVTWIVMGVEVFILNKGIPIYLLRN